MVLATKSCLETTAPGDMQMAVCDSMERRLASELASTLEPGRHYCVNVREPVVREEAGFNTITMEIEVEPMRELRAVHISAEEMYLPPVPSLKVKLKNCWKYLRSRTGGYVRYEETSHA